MPTFIDESGDTGHGRTSSPFFRLVAVWMPSIDAAHEFRASIRQVRRQTLGLGDDFEFKYSKTHSQPNRRHVFFERALCHQFRFAFCAIDKLKGRWRNAAANEQHWAAATDLAVSFRAIYHDAESATPYRQLREPIWVDDNRDRKFLDAIRAAFQGLRSRLYPRMPMVCTPKFRRSAREEVLQLADMICGATGDFVEGHGTWFDRIRSRCVGLTTLP